MRDCELESNLADPTAKGSGWQEPSQHSTPYLSITCRATSTASRQQVRHSNRRVRRRQRRNRVAWTEAELLAIDVPVRLARIGLRIAEHMKLAVDQINDPVVWNS